MSIINFPGGLNFPGFSSYTLKLIRKSVQLLSAFTGRRQVVSYPFALWSFSGKFSTADNYNASLLRSFFVQLQGTANKFRLPLPEYITSIYNTGFDGGFISTGGQTGNSLLTTGWPASTPLFGIGEYFTVNDELKIVRSLCFSDGSGNATITFDPALRQSPTALTQLQYGKPINRAGWSNVLTMTTFNGKTIWQYSNATILGTAGTDPSGAAINTNLLNSSSGASAFAFQSIYFGNLANRTFTLSAYVKMGSGALPVQVQMQGDISGVVSASGVTTSGSYQRIQTTFTWPASTVDTTINIFIILFATAANQTVWIDGVQLEENTSASTLRVSTDGAGPVTALMALTADDGASWDLSPPVLYQFNLDAQEAFE